MVSKKEGVSADTGFFAFMKKRKRQIGLTTIICSTLTFNLAFASDPTTNITTNTTTKEIFHIYNGKEYIGAVTDEEKIDTLIAEKEEEASTQYKEFSVDAGSNIKVIPEQVFTVAVDEQQTLQSLEQSIVVEAQAMAFVVGGQTVAYVKDQTDFHKTMEELKLLYISQKELDSLNASNNSTEPPLVQNETRVKAVSIAENITGKAMNVNPLEITQPKQLAKRLVEGGEITKTYTVQTGDTLQSIAKAYGLTVNEVVEQNKHLRVDSELSAGQVVQVKIVKPYVNVEVQYEVLKVHAVEHQKIVKESASLLKGQTELEQQGQDGKLEEVVIMTEVNGERQLKATVSSEVVQQPVNEVEIVGTKEVPHVGVGSFAWPAVGGYISSKMGPRWGRSHDGIDIARPSDYTIKASDNGKVTSAGPDGTYGNKVVIDHNNGYETVYAHLSSISVEVGQTVAQGQKLV